MIKSLKIKNIALIEECKIEFEKGFNVLTGETGAGKSIIIDSLNFVLGAKTDKNIIKNGKTEAQVEAVFEINKQDEQLIQLFNSLGLEIDDYVVISRLASINGKNEIRVNGDIVTLNMLKKLTINLVDVFGQHDHQVLMDTKNHLFLLDVLCKKDLEIKIQLLNEKLNLLKDLNKQFSDLGGSENDRLKELELLDYEINEIESANLIEDEETELIKKKNIYINSEKILDGLKNTTSNLCYDQDVVACIKSAINSLMSISKFDDDFNSSITQLTDIKYNLEDICAQLKKKQNEVSYSENDLNMIEERLELLRDLKRKYGRDYSSIMDYLNASKDRKFKLENAQQQLDICLKEKSKLLKEIYNISIDITTIRKEKAITLKEKMISELKDLGIKNADFEVQFNSYSLDNIEKIITARGCDDVEFLFSANLGEPVKSLNKIISGGEMSRFMLAFKCVVNSGENYKTFIFDEIDTGIGGQIGAIVGKKIAKISKNNQVICITHLSQIASFSDNHFKISKYEDASKTYTNVKLLSNDEKIEEIARMIGSLDKVEFAYLHAKEIIFESDNYKQKLVV